jgi:hypothetical protein
MTSFEAEFVAIAALVVASVTLVILVGDFIVDIIDMRRDDPNRPRHNKPRRDSKGRFVK